MENLSEVGLQKNTAEQDKYMRNWITFSVQFDLLYDDLMTFFDLKMPKFVSRVNITKALPQEGLGSRIKVIWRQKENRYLRVKELRM